MPFAQPGKRKLCSKRNGDGCAAMFGRRISVCRHCAGVPIFLNAAKKTLSIVYELQLLPVLCPCTFSQRVFAEIHTFYSEFLVEPYIFLWMSLLREIFCTMFSKTSHAVDTTRARANCVQNENSKGYALCVSCVWIATSRCSPNKSKLREQCSPRSFLMSTFQSDYLDCAADTFCW